MKNWKMVRLGEVLKQSKNTVVVEGIKKYPQIGIRLWGEGAYEREVVSGTETQYKFFYKAQCGDFTFNKIWARNGASAIIPKKLDGFFVSPEFPVFHTNQDKVLSEWLLYLTKSQFFWNACSAKAFGTSGKNRIKPDELLSIEIPLPPLAEQQLIVSKLEAVQKAAEKVRILRGEQERLVRNLMYSKYCELIENAEWQPMKEVAPIIRREIEINEQKSYAELGIRSFGKGTFHKPPLAGIEVGTKRLYAIKPKDLLFSNVFAWEGAIAVATANDDNRYGSHRFISCKTDENQAIPEFLWFHFLTEKGLEDINAASPGGAGRNKTLGLQKLEKIQVPIPPLSMQQDFIAIKAKLETLKIHQHTQRQVIEGLLPSMLDRVFGKEM